MRGRSPRLTLTCLALHRCQLPPSSHRPHSLLSSTCCAPDPPHPFPAPRPCTCHFLPGFSSLQRDIYLAPRLSFMASLLGQAFPKHPAKGSTSSGSLFITPATLPASFPSQCEDVQTQNGPAPLDLLFLCPPPIRRSASPGQGLCYGHSCVP